MKSFCYLGDRLNTSDGNEVAVTARTENLSCCFAEESFRVV